MEGENQNGEKRQSTAGESTNERWSRLLSEVQKEHKRRVESERQIISRYANSPTRLKAE